MGGRNWGFAAEEQNEVSVNDALIFTTISIVGFLVDVHVKDGSIYSGTFHTASVDDGYCKFNVILVIHYFLVKV